MTRKTYRIRRITVAIALAASGPVLAAQPAPAFDARSPDAREAAEQTRAGSVVDLRSPDAREAAEQANVGSRITVDLRSPDAREAADQGDPSRGISVVDARSPDASDAAAAIGVDNSAATLTILVGAAPRTCVHGRGRFARRLRPRGGADRGCGGGRAWRPHAPRVEPRESRSRALWLGTTEAPSS